MRVYMEDFMDEDDLDAACICRITATTLVNVYMLNYLNITPINAFCLS